MANPTTRAAVPDPANSYERADPNQESTDGTLQAPKAEPARRPDRQMQAVTNKQNPAGHVTSDQESNAGPGSPPLVDEEEIEGSMHTEEPTGWDQAPQSIPDPKKKRHPRTEGKGGVDAP